MLDDSNFSSCPTTFELVFFDTANPAEANLFYSVLEGLSTKLDRLAAKKPQPYLSHEHSVDQVLNTAFKWFIGSGRVIWFATKIISAFKPELTKGSPAFNMEVTSVSQVL